MLVVKVEGETVPVKAMWSEGGFSVEVEGRGEKVMLNSDWILGQPMMLADINGKEVAIQVHIYIINFIKPHFSISKE